jgi:hypothetical protein
MANIGEATAREHPLEVVNITVKDGKAPKERFALRANQRVTFQNEDAEDYRLRLRHGEDCTVVSACVLLPALKTADLIMEPISEELRPPSGRVATVEILPASEAVMAGIIKGPGGPPGKDEPPFVLYIIDVPKSD